MVGHRWALQKLLCETTLASCEGTCAQHCSACSARRLPAARQVPRPGLTLTMQHLERNLVPAMRHISNNQPRCALVSPNQEMQQCPVLPMPSSRAQHVSS